MTLKKQSLLCFVFVCQFALAQYDSITVLKTVVVADSQLSDFSGSKKLLRLNDSIINKNQATLTSLLNYNSTIYLKENGLGMVASPSFRGTTAQQTAVIWNGININSQLNGQTDFNLLNTRNFDNIVVRAGGGSAIYGSSAVGGTIHLNNDILFEKKISNNFDLAYGSFNTTNLNYKLNISKSNIYNQLLVTRNSSENNYQYIDSDLKNENGKYFNKSLSYNFGYKWRKNTIKLYSQLFESERFLSGTLAAFSKSKYQDFNTRNLIEWENAFDKFVSKTKFAFLTEQYKYFEDANATNFSFGKAETLIAKYDLAYKLKSNLEFNNIVDYNKTKGFGSDIEEDERQIISAVILMKHKVFDKLQYEIAVRKEFTDNYKSPILFSFGIKYKAFKNYNLRFNCSRNFRIPSFNDLYWQNAGNKNLKPENAFQTELGHDLVFKNIKFSLTGFYNKIEDLINWQPNSSGFWQPQNTKSVKSYGLECNLVFDKKIANHNINFTANYGYTVSENQETKQQLIYVPLHKLTNSLAYSYKKTSVYFQMLFNGKVFTSSDNSYFLRQYSVVNAGIEYDFGKKNNYKIGFNVLNVFNQNYQIVSIRPMPGRNYNLNINFKI